jgi:2-oxoglutarate ferredoxin oxidoreductase subunit gamma
LGTKELRIAGFGGQGVVLAGQIVGKAASIYDDGYSTLTQSYGPEARGGSCAAEVVISREPIGYPYVQDPNVVILLSQEAYTRYGRDLPPDTLAIIDPDLVKPDEAQNPAPLAIPATRMARELGRVMVANIITLGFLAAVGDLVSPQALKEAVLTSVPKGTEELNSKAFDQGYDHGLEHGRGSEGANG